MPEDAVLIRAPSASAGFLDPAPALALLNPSLALWARIVVPCRRLGVSLALGIFDPYGALRCLDPSLALRARIIAPWGEPVA